MPPLLRYVGAIVLLMCIARRACGEEVPRIAPPIVRAFISDGRLSWYRLEDGAADVRVAIRSTVAVERPEGDSSSACRVDKRRGTNLSWWPRTAKVGSGHSWFCAVDVPAALSFSNRESFPITTLYRVPLRDYQPCSPGRPPEEREHWSDEVIDAEFGRAKESHGHPDDAGYSVVGWCFPVDDAYYQLGRARGNLEPSHLYDKIGYDFVVVDANRLRIYVLAPEPVAYPLGAKSQYPKSLYVLDYEFRAARFDPYGPGDPRPPGLKNYERTGWRWQYKTNRVVESEVSEPFQVVADGDRAMLIIESGSLYAVPSETAGAPNRLRKIGLRDGQIVQALISDDDHDGRTFAFTSRYWFEVKEPIEYHDFEMTAFKATDPLPTLLECARAVRKDLNPTGKSGDATPAKVR